LLSTRTALNRAQTIRRQFPRRKVYMTAVELVVTKATNPSSTLHARQQALVVALTPDWHGGICAMS